MQAATKTLKSEFGANDSSYALRWEYCPLRTGGTASTSSPTKGGDGAGSSAGKKVTATIATSIPPNIRGAQSQSSGLFGAAYAVPKLTLVEAEKGKRV